MVHPDRSLPTHFDASINGFLLPTQYFKRRRPMIRKSRFVIAVPNLAASAQFYQDVLGFTVEDIGDSGWRFFIKDHCCIMAGHCPDAIPPEQTGDHAYFAYLLVDDIDTYFQTVKQNGATILKPLCNEPWGMREFAICTLDGHRMMFGCDIDIDHSHINAS